MCTSGCGVITAIFLSRWNSASLSATSCAFQYTSPSLFTEISMFSGLVWRAMLVSLGSCIATVCVTTGIVIRKMINSTSITSTNGVVLMLETTSSSPPLSLPTFIAMIGSYAKSRACASAYRLGTHQHAMQVGAEAAHRFHRHLVATHQPVVAEHRRHRDRQADRRHDERFTHRAGHLVDRRLPCNADRGQRVVDAPG